MLSKSVLSIENFLLKDKTRQGVDRVRIGISIRIRNSSLSISI